MSNDFRVFLDLIRKILKSYFTFASKNKLLLVESLFRFSDRLVKDAILSNYEDESIFENAQNNAETQNRHRNDDYEGGFGGGRTVKVWSKVEDRTLLQNYEEFRNLPNAEDHLCLMINNLGFSDKEPIDIRRRIKFFKLDKSPQKAKAIFDELYQNQKNALKKSLKAFLEGLGAERFTKEDFLEFLGKKFREFKEFKKHRASEAK